MSGSGGGSPGGSDLSGLLRRTQELSDSMKEIEKSVREIARNRVRILDEFAKAYLSDTGLRPSEVVLVEQHTPNGFKIWFEKKEKKDDSN